MTLSYVAGDKRVSNILFQIILCGYLKCGIFYNLYILCTLIWKVALNFGLSAWNEIWEKAGEDNNVEAYITNGETFC